MDPHSEYTRRLEARKAVTRRYDRLDSRLSTARLVTGIGTALLGWLVFAQQLFSPWWIAAPACVFVVLVAVHDRVRRKRDRAKRAAAFYEKGLERLEGRWSGRGDCGESFLDETHLYAHDLDLFGRGGLFELLCTARTLAGQRTLAYWLLHPASPEEVRLRQEAVEELRERLDLREDFALMGEEVRRGTHAGALPQWGEAPPVVGGRRVRIAAAVLSLLVLASIAAWAVHGISFTVFLVVLVIEGVFALGFRTRVFRVVQAVEQPAHDVAVLGEVLERLERERFTSARLTGIQEALRTKGRPPSQRIRRLKRLIDMLDSRDHLLIRAIGPPLLWTTQLAFAIEAWRTDCGGSLRQWLRAVGEFGALSSFASYSFEHPADPFPEVGDGAPLFDGAGLGHPLIPEDQCVRNDVCLSSDLQVLLVSGSNMSGKSTLLRTVGINAVLALAGAPVRATSLRIHSLRVGASIRVTDSLQSGVSRFYAEITRIRQLMDLAGRQPTLLFLLDELLHGTNSHDRRIGADAIIRGLVGRGALGLVTTHDLALAHIADEMAPRVRNVHFEDHLEEGKMKFDYKLHPGVVEHSNAIQLMRSVGLDV